MSTRGQTQCPVPPWLSTSLDEQQQSSTAHLAESPQVSLPLDQKGRDIALGGAEGRDTDWNDWARELLWDFLTILDSPGSRRQGGVLCVWGGVGGGMEGRVL